MARAPFEALTSEPALAAYRPGRALLALDSPEPELLAFRRHGPLAAVAIAEARAEIRKVVASPGGREGVDFVAVA